MLRLILNVVRSGIYYIIRREMLTAIWTVQMRNKKVESNPRETPHRSINYKKEPCTLLVVALGK